MSDRLHPDPHTFDHQQPNPQRVPQYPLYSDAGCPPIQLPLPHTPSDGSRSQSFYQQTEPAYAPTSNYSTPASSRPVHPASAPPQASFARIAPNGDLRHNLDVRANSLQETPTRHVVGSQGRRGILPSAAGMPPASTTATNGKNSPPLLKDEDGKFPCPHCNKPYLHAKHLKRHMLRHTGVRPYQCGLCKDTFSRSDILKRHFSKCSVRRGNPTGENHLAFSRANKKKHREAEERQKEELLSQQQLIAMTLAQPYTPTYSTASSTLDSPVGLGNFDLPQAPSQEPLANTVRHNEMRRANSYSNRGSTSSLNFDHLSGHVTPDSSITTSGAATPGQFQHDRSSLNSPADANFNMSNTNPRNSANFQNGALPHVYAYNESWNLSALGSQEDLPAQTFSSNQTSNHGQFKDDATANFQFGDYHFPDPRS